MRTIKEESEKLPLTFKKHTIEGGTLVTASNGSLLIFNKDGLCLLEVIRESEWEYNAIIRKAETATGSIVGIKSDFILDKKCSLYYDDNGQKLFSECTITKYGRILNVFKDGLPHCVISIDEEYDYSVDSVSFIERIGDSSASTKQTKGAQDGGNPSNQGYINHADINDIFHLESFDMKVEHRILFKDEIALNISFTIDGLPYLSSYIWFKDYKVSRRSDEKCYSISHSCNIISLPLQQGQDIESFVNQKFQDDYRCFWNNDSARNS